ncbi:MAG: bifunctional DNA-formamidopyrimidine glycosylase/DNA-(apurinic or apyrimidinic site) lyase, partial [Bdellovibrionales bacterium]|nr:bifunctional DNA-formamidopyrimidine glycosylase/DNA-(apurinic or apyrimidinic site) lyase [Bdellovibrionales bacterium]
MSNKKKLVYNDSRRFGLFEIADKGAVTENKWLKFLGPEPLDKKNFNSTYLFQGSRSRKVPVKAFIMDQKVVVGVGNIYASEALFRAGLRPQIRANKLTQQDAKQLVASVRTIISKAIKSGGTTIRDFAQTNGQKGYFARQLKVYGRTGEPCFDCQTEICCQSIGGRTSFWCPH